MAPATATTTVTAIPTVNTTTESLQLIRCLLRVSVFHVAYLRGLFPEKEFMPVDMQNLDGLQVSMLKPSTPAAQALVQWVDVGVADALAKGYLSTLQFGIAATPDCAQLIETYTYKFTYADDSSVSGMHMVGGAGAAGRSASTGALAQPSSKATLQTVKAGVVTMIRSLVQLCQTLAPVPAQHHLFIKLTYRAHTPEGYEPPGGFAPAAAADAIHRAVYTSKPFTFDAGAVQTRAHAVSLGLASTLDAMTVGGLAGGSQPVRAESGECASLSMLLSEKVVRGGGGSGGGVAAAGKALAGLGLTAVTEDDEDMVSSQQVPTPAVDAAAALAAVRGHCFAAAAAAADRAGTRKKGRGGGGGGGAPFTVEYAGLVACFAELSIPTLDAALAALVREGVLATADGGKAYTVVGGCSTAGPSCLGGMVSGSEGGGVSERSVGAPSKKAAAAAPPPPAKKRAKKVSMVKQPGGGGGACGGGGGGAARGGVRAKSRLNRG